MPRPIFETLREIRAGGLLNEATEALAELVHAVNETGKSGEIAIRLKLKLANRGSSTMIVDADVKKTIPEPDREVAFFFPTKDGGLSKQDPNQIPLGLRPVSDMSDPPLAQRERVDLETGEISPLSAS